MLNTRRSSDVPADIRGIQRVEYTSYDYKPEKGLGDVLVRLILSKEHWYKRIHKMLAGDSKTDKKMLLALRILAHLRDHERLTLDHLKTLVRGTRLRKEDRDVILEKMRRLRLIQKLGNTNVYKLRRRLFRR